MQSVGASLSETYEAQPDAAARARVAVDDFARDAGVSRRQIDDIRLVTSEAVTNAVLHAYRDQPGVIRLTTSIVDGELWLIVADDGCGLDVPSDRPGLGLGLGLIAEISDHFAVVAVDGGGTELRIRFTLSHAEPACARASGRGARGRIASLSARR